MPRPRRLTAEEEARMEARAEMIRDEPPLEVERPDPWGRDADWHRPRETYFPKGT